MKRLLDRALSYLRGRPEAGTTRRKPIRRPRLGLEQLEDRSVPSATIVKDIRIGADLSSNPANLTVVGTTLYFTANDGKRGVELWKTDTTTDTTTPVTDINPRGSSDPMFLTAVGDALYFSANDGTTGRELWVVDAAGTRQVRDIRPRPRPGQANPGSNPVPLAAVGNTLYFSADDGTAVTGGVSRSTVWTTTGVGATELKAKNAAGVESRLFEPDLYPGQATLFRGKLYFVADYAGRGTPGLWVTDGTPTGTRKFAEVAPGSTASRPGQLKVAGDRLYYLAAPDNFDQQLWVTDGTAGNTRQLAGGTLQGKHPNGLTVVGTTLYFTAKGEKEGGGPELWATGGPVGTTRQVSDINTMDNTPYGPGSFPRNLTAIDGFLYFSAFDPTHGQEVWFANPGNDHVERLTDIKRDPTDKSVFRNTYPDHFRLVNGVLCFVATDAFDNRELWAVGGGVRSLEILPGLVGSTPEQLTVVGNTLYFTAGDGTGGRELWATDGTTRGTFRVKDIYPDRTGSDPAQLTAVGDTLYFTARDDTRGHELWRVGLPKVSFTAAASAGSETPHPVTLTVELSAPSDEEVTVDYRVVPAPFGVPTPGEDYTLADGTLTFAPGVTTRTIIIRVLQDGQVEGDETIEVELTSPRQATLGEKRLHSHTILGARSSSVSGPFGTARATGSAGSDAAGRVGTDAAGNVYVTGTFQGTVDFDPGPGATALRAAGTSSETYVAKYTPAGALVWARRPAAGATVTATAADAAGNVYQTGSFSGTVDFGPGAGRLTSGGGADAFVAKLDAAGNYVWARRLGGTGEFDGGAAVAADAAGNVVVVGRVGGTADLDPGPGTVPSVGASGFVVKLSAGGDLLWARTLTSDYGYLYFSAVAVDGAGNVVSAGTYQASYMDFDPGPGTYSLGPLGSPRGFVWKLDAGGNFVWANRLDGGPDGHIAALATDAAGNVYSAGSFTGGIDFDPGPGTFRLTARAVDGFVWKLSPAGKLVWARAVGGEGSGDVVGGVAVDAAGNLYAGGALTGTADFDPGAGTLNLSSGGRHDADGFVWKLDRDGNLVWARQLAGDSSAAHGVAVDGAGNVYAAGTFTGTADFDPGPGAAALTSGGSDAFVWKMRQS